VQRHFYVLKSDEELRLYVGFFALASTLLVVELLAGGFASGEEAFRIGVFHAVAIMTTTGFATSDYTAWGPLASMTLLLLMFIGASAGSTGGSIKVVRHLLLFKLVRRELEQTIHREAVVPVRANGVAVDERALRSTVVFVLLYLLTFALGALGLVVDARRGGADLGPSRPSAPRRLASATSGPAFGFRRPVRLFRAVQRSLDTDLHRPESARPRRDLPVAVLLLRSYWRV
jgi:trk system potassium uptake protein TrkH